MIEATNSTESVRRRLSQAPTSEHCSWSPFCLEQGRSLHVCYTTAHGTRQGPGPAATEVQDGPSPGKSGSFIDTF